MVDLRLYLVTDSSLVPHGSTLEQIVERAVSAGVTVVQLREKELAQDEFIAKARSIKSICDKHNVPLIINDNVEVAQAVDAAGVHIGQSDASYEQARKILGANKIIGLSVETLEQAEQANELDVDYIAVSPIFSTSTKLDIAPPFGYEGARQVVEITNHPTVAIGGLNLSNVAEAMRCGIDGVAVVSAIIAATDPAQASRELRSAIDNR